MTDVELSISLLLSQTLSSIVAIFWYTLLFDLPRYALPFAAVALSQRREPSSVDAAPLFDNAPRKVSVVLIGHNEAPAKVRLLRPW